MKTLFWDPASNKTDEVEWLLDAAAIIVSNFYTNKSKDSLLKDEAGRILNLFIKNKTKILLQPQINK